jgi:hypothetical protein
MVALGTCAGVSPVRNMARHVPCPATGRVYEITTQRDADSSACVAVGRTVRGWKMSKVEAEDPDSIQAVITRQTSIDRTCSGTVGGEKMESQRPNRDDILARVDRATERLRELGEVLDVNDLPMSCVSDDELDHRIELAEAGALEMWTPRPVDSRIDPGVAVQLQLLDFLIDHPAASVPPLWALGSPPEFWPDQWAFGENATTDNRVLRDRN